jgi:hypothetical protein
VGRPATSLIQEKQLRREWDMARGENRQILRALRASKEGLVAGISRRAWLRSGTAMAAIGLVPGWAFETDPPAPPELFVFRAPHSVNTVIGLSIPADFADPTAATTRIHVGAKVWSMDLAGPTHTRFTNDDRVRIFAGRGMIGAGFVQAIVLELDARELALTETFDVWAEIALGKEMRWRIGNPIVAELVRCHRELAQIHRQVSPTNDRAILTPVVTKIIAARARRLGIVKDPDAYARRLALTILPDVISFAPASPLGFSFAGQNGRHPAERSAEVVHTLLGGSLVQVSSERGQMPLDRFPYLISPIELT